MAMSRVVEDDDRLRLALFADLEIGLAERRHQPSVTVGDRDEDADDVAAAAEGRLLSGRGRDRKTDRDKPGSKTLHRTIPRICVLAFQSYHDVRRAHARPFPTADRPAARTRRLTLDHRTARGSCQAEA